MTSMQQDAVSLIMRIPDENMMDVLGILRNVEALVRRKNQREDREPAPLAEGMSEEMANELIAKRGIPSQEEWDALDRDGKILRLWGSLADKASEECRNLEEGAWERAVVERYGHT